MRWYIFLGLVLLVACTQETIVCTEPYIDAGGRCCLDADADGTCDTTDSGETSMDCSLCPPKFVTEYEDVIMYKYVCMNGSIMEASEECGERIVSNAHEFTVNKQQDDSLIEEFDSRPACRGKYKAVELHIEPVGTASRMTVQVMRKPGTSYDDLYILNWSNSILDDEYVYIGLCDDFDCTLVTDAQVEPTTAYKFRIDMVIDGERVFTRDRLVDPTPEGAYSQQKC